MANTADYFNMLKSLLPPGEAFDARSRGRDGGTLPVELPGYFGPVGGGSPLRQILTAWADEFARLDARVQDLIAESDPRNAAELLSDYERALGLPNPCQYENRSTVAQRREAVVAMFRERGGVTLERLKKIAESVGADVEIFEEDHDAHFGIAEMGVDLFATENFSSVVIREAGQIVIDARFSTTHFSERYKEFGNLILECLMPQYIRADRAIRFEYVE